jgi:hypothetical protein
LDLDLDFGILDRRNGLLVNCCSLDFNVLHRKSRLGDKLEQVKSDGVPAFAPYGTIDTWTRPEAASIFLVAKMIAGAGIDTRNRNTRSIPFG